MNIGIDLRSLSSGSISGVENYIVNLIEHMLPLDRKNQYTLFFNSWANRAPDNFHFINSKTKATKVPNKILNLGLKLNLIKLEKLTGPTDWLLLPNLNQFSIAPQTKLAITVHDLSPVVTPEFYDLKRRMWHSFLNYKKSFERADVIFAVSEYTKTDLMRLFNVPANKIVVAYPGVNSMPSSQSFDGGDLRNIRNQYDLPGNFLLFLSTIEPRKNLENLIAAFEGLDNDAHLVIFGKKGWKYRGIFRKIQGSTKRDKIHYRGYVEEADKLKIVRMAKAVVYPSFYEGFGFVPLEAMSAGVPVVASAVTSIPEIVGDAALLVNPYNIPEISHALMQILTNEALRSGLILKGKDRSRDFTWEKTARTILHFLEPSL